MELFSLLISRFSQQFANSILMYSPTLSTLEHFKFLLVLLVSKGECVKFLESIKDCFILQQINSTHPRIKQK